MQMSQGFARIGPTALLYICFGLGATCQTLAMQKSGEMGMTYILIIGLEAVLAVVCGSVLFHENYSILKLVGVVLVTIGVLFLRSGSN